MFNMPICPYVPSRMPYANMVICPYEYIALGEGGPGRGGSQGRSQILLDRLNPSKSPFNALMPYNTIPYHTYANMPYARMSVWELSMGGCLAVAWFRMAYGGLGWFKVIWLNFPLMPLSHTLLYYTIWGYDICPYGNYIWAVWFRMVSNLGWFGMV